MNQLSNSDAAVIFFLVLGALATWHAILDICEQIEFRRHLKQCPDCQQHEQEHRR